ncbi:hypothetical protein LguiA_033981 [Lonicera macranthoides]
MDSGQELGFLSEDIIQIIPINQENGGENQGSGLIDTAVWANKDDYGASNIETSIDNTYNSNYDGRRQTLAWSDSDSPCKKPRNSLLTDSPSTNRSRVIPRVFFKTKLCCKFQAKTCPYESNCNFAHGLEELRVLPPNWKEIVAADEEERRVLDEPREEFQIPSLGSSGYSIESSRSSGRLCQKFFTQEGCPYGDRCNFFHDEQLRNRESVAICLGPTSGGRYRARDDGGSGASGTSSKPRNWKTRICNKWEQTGNCPFGSKCNFAHGVGELHQFGGRPLVQTDAIDFSATVDPNCRSGALSNTSIPTQRLASTIQRTGRRPGEKWKGPDKISLIYGDWIEDLE